MKEDKKLKYFLVLQSFCPLFLLIFIQHIDKVHFKLFGRFFIGLFHGDLSVFYKIFSNEALGNVIITILCLIWFFLTAVFSWCFRNYQNSNFVHQGDMIKIDFEKKDSGVTFLVTFVLPLLVDDVSTTRGFVFFVVLLTMVVYLFMQSDLFYQNPVLIVLKYRTFQFKFNKPPANTLQDKTYIGICRKNLPCSETAVKWKYIADNVFLIYNDC